MHGDNVIFDGGDTCKIFRDTKPFHKRVIAPAGLFNTGTHLLYVLMRRNCRFANTRQVSFQVPWGKHNPPAWRHKTVARSGRGIIQDDVLPVVIIKDPINWIHSMCAHPYNGRWRHTAEHCPNLVPNENDKGRYKDGVVSNNYLVSFSFPKTLIVVIFILFTFFLPTYYIKVHATVKYDKTHVIPHESLLHIWVDNYNDWL